MTVKIPMPALSPTMTEGTLTKWLIKVGDQVKAGDVLAEIETDKATMEVEAVDEGKVAKLIVEEGTSNIPVNSTIAILDGDDKDQNEGDQDQTKDTVGIIKKKEIVDNNVVKKSSFEKKLGKKIIASPYAKSLAKKDKLTLDNIIGSGPGGRVIKRDLKNQKTSQPSIKTSQENISAPSSIRKIIADRTVKAKQTVPHFYLTIESKVDKLLQLRKKINENFGTKISINDMLVKALALAQMENPLTNVSWVEGQVIKYSSVDVSIAVALKEGLITPIVKNADKKGLIEISKEIKELVNKAKTGKLQLDEYTGGTISISNLGMFGIIEFSAIINPPQSSILAVGTIKKIPGVIEEEIRPISVLKSTLSEDHRVLDGAVAGKLLKDFHEIIEDPFDLWLKSSDMEII
ncbi:MAG: dihydrolipoamide acetyltransferase family protein [Pseudomonadota bacterium]|nr:dihydrolipoamide acetyltransferase family protein [Pseudomonadota bacterium]